MARIICLKQHSGKAVKKTVPSHSTQIALYVCAIKKQSLCLTPSRAIYGYSCSCSGYVGHPFLSFSKFYTQNGLYFKYQGYHVIEETLISLPAIVLKFYV